jgi:hypothetical protein
VRLFSGFAGQAATQLKPRTEKPSSFAFTAADSANLDAFSAP